MFGKQVEKLIAKKSGSPKYSRSKNKENNIEVTNDNSLMPNLVLILK